MKNYRTKTIPALRIILPLLVLLAALNPVSPRVTLGSLAFRKLQLRIDDFLIPIIVLALFITIMVGRKTLVLPNRSSSLFFLFVYAGLISTLLGQLFGRDIGEFRIESLLIWMKHLQYLLIFCAAAYFGRFAPSGRRLIIYGFLTGLLVSVAAGLIQVVTGDYWGQGRAGYRVTFPFENNPNVLASFLAICAPILLAMLLFRSERKAWLPLFILQLSLLLVVPYTGSRAGALSTIVGMAVVFALYLVVRRHYAALLLVVTVSILAALAIALLVINLDVIEPGGSVGRLHYVSPLERVKALEYGSTIAIRIEKSWEHALEASLGRPLFGKGMGLLGIREAENYYLRLLSEQGLIGLLLFFIFVGFTIRELWRAFCLGKNATLQVVALGVIGSLAATMVGSIAADKFTVVKIATPLWLLSGLLTGYAYRFGLESSRVASDASTE